MERLTKKGMQGGAHPVSDIGMIFLTSKDIMLDANVRKAMAHAIDKKAIVEKLLRGNATAIDTLNALRDAAPDEAVFIISGASTLK